MGFVGQALELRISGALLDLDVALAQLDAQSVGCLDDEIVIGARLLGGVAAGVRT